ncbi:MAG: YkgJ family cysteine cluster protein [Candidatus Heimdallarchaeota archaeon]|nr:YkgJ family cysteine cluster protein [Candidatus Heimdallarchaeota archaeon]MDH5645068.1 YkgJ family cysteine cluster protein [Candidatus Heimdallarchaeota archaeon]
MDTVNRFQIMQTLELVVEVLSTPIYSTAIAEIYLLGSVISSKSNPQDIDIMIIGDFILDNQSVLKSQQEIRRIIITTSSTLHNIDFSINFGESIESIQFQDGTVLESYLMIYSRKNYFDWRKWFDDEGIWKVDMINALGVVDTHVLRFDYPKQSNYLKMDVPMDGKNIIRLEDISLPKEAIWTFLNKRMNVPLPSDPKELFHPNSWLGCNQCGNCCKDFSRLRNRFTSEIPRIYDIIRSKFNGILWDTLEIIDEASWFWIVENGLDNYDTNKIHSSNPQLNQIPCPFLVLTIEKTNDGLCKSHLELNHQSVCLIYEDRPDGCIRFPEYREEMIEFNCLQ